VSFATILVFAFGFGFGLLDFVVLGAATGFAFTPDLAAGLFVDLAAGFLTEALVLFAALDFVFGFDLVFGVDVTFLTGFVFSAFSAFFNSNTNARRSASVRAASIFFLIWAVVPAFDLATISLPPD
jgi:hypothetical protein